MKRVAIMTWYQHKNYGTTLQALALQRAVKKYGYYVEGIDYYSKGYDRETFLEKILDRNRIAEGIHNKIKRILYKSVFDKRKQERYRRFEEKYIALHDKTQTSSQLFSLNKEFDAFICGSDQIWSPNEFNSKYFLDFVEDDKRKIAYAPSFGVSSIRDDCTRENIGKLISKIGHISVREEQGVNMLRDYYGVEAKVVLDPTLLLDADEWLEYSNRSYEVESDTLLCYFLGENKKVWKYVEKIAEEKKLKIAVIPVFDRDYIRKYKIFKGVGPAEFISLFSKAAYVCTDSFHGTVFSIIFQRDFSVFKRFSDNNPKSQNSRIINILGKLNLKRSLYNSDIGISKVNWISVNNNLNILKRFSTDFLKKSLFEATSNLEANEYTITNTCCGCGVCSIVCNSGAISINKRDGFFQAVVDQSKCTRCRLCQKVCSFNGEVGKGLDEAKIFESKSCDLNVLKRSTSGGIAHELLSDAVNKGKNVYGCAYDYKKKEAVHIKVSNNNIDMLRKIQGSKYLQSDFISNLGDIIKKSQGVIIGTPCQIAGVDNYLRLKKKRDKFILIDLICHGVPSYLLWEKYLKEQGLFNTLKEVRFRNKEAGWRNIEIFLTDGINKISRKESKDLFYNYFDLQVCYMKSCYECNYRQSSKADLRLGDYWGKKYTEDDLKNGTSMVVAFTKYGEEVLKSLTSNNKITLTEKNVTDYYLGQGPQNPIIPVFYDRILKQMTNSSDKLVQIMNKYFRIKYYNKQLQFLMARLKRR